MSEANRQSLKAYLQLQKCHKELHKVLKSLEEDATEDEILRRLEAVTKSLDAARTLLTS